MTAYPAPLNQDVNEVPTSAQWDAVNGRWVLYVNLVNTTFPVTVSGLTQAEDAIHASGDSGVMMLAIRQDTIAALAADGDYIPLTVDSLGRLRVRDAANQTEDAVAASGDIGTFMLAVRRDSPTSGAANGDYHELEVDALGRLWISGTQIEDAVAASGDAGHFMLAVRRDTPTSDAAAGDYHALHVDALGRLRTIEMGSEDPSTQRTSALAASLVVKASAGKLWGFQGYSTTAGFILVHNTTSVPADGQVPAEVIPCTAGAPFSFDGGKKGIPFSTGITIVFSSTGPTKTIGGSVMWVSCQYE